MTGKPWGEVREFGGPNKTLCDFDGGFPAGIRQRVRAIRRLMEARPKRIRWHRTARGYHLVIEWSRTFTRSQIVALQLYLGSDPSRELLNLHRADCVKPIRGGEFWNVLYSRKLH